MDTPSSLTWGKQDITHRKTNSDSIFHHLPNCDVIEFEECGHFPELENVEEYVQLVQERIGEYPN